MADLLTAKNAADIKSQVPSFTGAPSAAISQPTAGQTVMTDANVREKVIPALDAKAAKIAVPAYGSQVTDLNGKPGVAKYDPNTGQPLANTGTSGGSGTSADTNSYEELYKSMFDSGASSIENDPIIQQEKDLLSSMKQSSDAQYNAQLANMQQNYQSLYQTTVAGQKSTSAGLENTLLLNGNARYAPVSGSGILSAKTNYDIQNLQQLAGKEATAEAAVTSAREDKYYQLLGEQLKILDNVRQAKLTLTDKINTKLESQIKEKNDQALKTKSDIENVALQAAKNGADPQTIKNINSAGSLGDAISAAGDTLQTGTGQLGDYLQYKRDAAVNGIIPQNYENWKAADDLNQEKLKEKAAYGTAFASAKGKAAAEGTNGNNPSLSTSPVTSPDGILYNAPASVAPYVNFASNGVKYVDLSNFAGTPTEKNKAVQDAQSAGYKVITNKNSAIDVQNISDALAKIDLIDKAFSNLAASSPTARNLYQAGSSKLAAFLQSDPNKASLDVFNDASLDILKAISGTQGFRGNTESIRNVQDSLPKLTDTIDTVKQKIENVKALIQAREDALVGKPNASDASLLNAAQSKNKINSFISLNPDKADTIAKLYEVPGATDESIYSALKARNLIQ